MERAGFAAELIAALQEAQAAAAAPRSAESLAQAAYDKLHFDFPDVNEPELAALLAQYRAGQGYPISIRFLQVLRDSAASGAAAAGAPAAASGATGAAINTEQASGSSSSDSRPALLLLYQQLFATAVLQALLGGLGANQEQAAAQLALLQDQQELAAAEAAAEGPAPVVDPAAALARLALEAAAATTQELVIPAHTPAAQEDDDAIEYEPLEVASQPTATHSSAPPKPWRPSSGGAAVVPAAAAASPAAASQQQQQEQLVEGVVRLAGQLEYHCLNEERVWVELALMQQLAGCLAALRAHPQFPQLEEAAAALLRLAHDRMAAQPAELEALPALLGVLGVGQQPGSGSSSSGSSAGSAARPDLQRDPAAAAAASLALLVPASLSAQLSAPSARRRLWQHVHERLLPLAAALLEAQQLQLARQARQQAATATGAAAAEHLRRALVACQLLQAYIRDAPTPARARLQDTLLRDGLFRALVLLFLHQQGSEPHAEPLRRALLLACAASPALADWAAAVPGFGAALQQPAYAAGGAAAVHGALWAVLQQRGGGEQLEGLLRDASSADKVPAVHEVLQLMGEVHAAAQPRRVWPPRVDAALQQLGGVLRREHSPSAAAAAGGGAAAAGQGKQQQEAQRQEEGEQEEEDEEQQQEEEERKLGVAPEARAQLLAGRRAAQLQPLCLRLVKELLLRQGAAGKGD